MMNEQPEKKLSLKERLALKIAEQRARGIKNKIEEFVPEQQQNVRQFRAPQPPVQLQKTEKVENRQLGRGAFKPSENRKETVGKSEQHKWEEEPEIEKIDSKTKALIIGHLKEQSAKIKQIESFLQDYQFKEAIETEILEKLPQIFLHSSMVLRAINEDEFENRIDQMMALNKDAIMSLDMAQEIEKQQDVLRLQHFNFAKGSQ